MRLKEMKVKKHDMPPKNSRMNVKISISLAIMLILRRQNNSHREACLIDLIQNQMSD
jgi:hypothetical protein